MKKSYTKPSVKIYAAEATGILAESFVHNEVGGTQLSNQMNPFIEEDNDDKE